MAPNGRLFLLITPIEKGCPDFTRTSFFVTFTNWLPTNIQFEAPCAIGVNIKFCKEYLFFIYSVAFTSQYYRVFEPLSSWFYMILSFLKIFFNRKIEKTLNFSTNMITRRGRTVEHIGSDKPEHRRVINKTPW